MTTTRLLEAYETLTAAEHDPSEGFFVAMSARQIRELLSDNAASGNGPTIGSMDFNSRRALVDAGVEGIQWAGFTILRSERLGTGGTGGDRECLCWARNSMLLAVAEEPRARISEREDKNYSTQVWMRFDIGATRMEEDGVVVLECDES